jgi:hypothetical protein
VKRPRDRHTTRARPSRCHPAPSPHQSAATTTSTRC